MSKNLAAKIKKEFQRLNWFIVAIFVLLIALMVATFFVVYSVIYGTPFLDWLVAMAISATFFILGIVLAYAVVDRTSERIQTTTSQMVDAELHQLRAANNRAKSLQSMASVMRATLSFERVVEEALDVCSLAIEEMGVPRQSLVGAVFLFNGEDLVPVATRRFTAVDFDKQLQGKRGIVGAALTQAEPVTTDHPRQDPELRQFVAFQNCLTAACIPLRAGFQIFGAIVIGSDTALKFDKEHFELFNGVADQAVIALQNAQLYQRLEAEKLRIIEADEEARKELARDLHDGPTQTIAAIAMRINFIRSLLSRDPEQALGELEKVEELAKQTSKEIRGMLFTLRPLVLETQGLGPAIETVIARIKETDGLNIRLIGGEQGELLNDQAQSVVFSIVEEALGNARKYSRASKIQVRFWQEDNLFVALVQDNGVGFDVQAVNQDYSSRGSLGMVNMRERADRIDGSLRLDSSPGHGTSVTLVVPLDKHGSHVAA
ncbi:MAG: histidine kinase [Candidatus Promineifilaceae bacterium]